MQGEITRKNVLLECLSIMRQELAVCSKHYNGLEPKEGMEEAWEQGRKKVQILQDMIHAYESEPVRRALADWQKDVMENGPRALEVEDIAASVTGENKFPHTVFYTKGQEKGKQTGMVFYEG